MASLKLENCGILLFIIVTNCTIAEELLLPFGPENGDKTAGVNDDGCTGPIRISKMFPFFDRIHDTLVVCTNGVIAPREVFHYSPDPFPQLNDVQMIAPFFADVDLTENDGRVYYRFVYNEFA